MPDARAARRAAKRRSQRAYNRRYMRSWRTRNRARYRAYHVAYKRAHAKLPKRSGPAPPKKETEKRCWYRCGRPAAIAIERIDPRSWKKILIPYCGCC